MSCLSIDPSHSDQYKTLIYRDGDIEGMYLKFLLDRGQMQDFADYESPQQA